MPEVGSPGFDRHISAFDHDLERSEPRAGSPKDCLLQAGPFGTIRPEGLARGHDPFLDMGARARHGCSLDPDLGPITDQSGQ